jgi:ketosteroid isomerase-like protein
MPEDRAISREHAGTDPVALTRRLLDAAERRDFAGLRGLLAPDAIWEVMSLDTRFEGAAASLAFLEDWLGAYQDYEIEPEEILDLGSGIVFAAVRLAGRPIAGGNWLVRRRPLALVWAGGLLVRAAAHAGDLHEGRAAAERLASSEAGC